MGFIKALFGIEDDDKKENNLSIGMNLNTDESSEPEMDSTNDTTFVTDDEEQDFEESIYGKIQLYRTDILYIKEVLPERGDNLERQIDILTKLLEVKNDENDPDIQKSFQELERMYEEDKRMADGEYTIKELVKQNKQMNKTFENSLEQGGINKEKLDEFISYISKIQKKISESDHEEIPLLTKVQRQKFNNTSMESEYRIKMLELMYLLSIGEVEVNPFKNLSVLKQRIFSEKFFQDVQIAQAQYSSLADSEEIFNRYNRNYFTSIDGMAKRLTDQLIDASMVEDFSIRQLFDSKNSDIKSFAFLKEFIRFKTTLNEMREKRLELIQAYNREQEEIENEKANQLLEQQRKAEADAEAKRKEAERLEYLKNISNQDINRRIDEIEQDLTATGSRFVNILDFQKEVARAKGLLDTESEVQSDELLYYLTGPFTLSKIIEKANKKGVNYLIFPDSQERDNRKLFIFIVSRSDSEITNSNIENASGSNFRNLSYSSDWYTYRNLGTYNPLVAERLEQKIYEEDESMTNNLSINEVNGFKEIRVGYFYYVDQASIPSKNEMVLDKLGEIYDELDDFGAGEEYLQKILCYIKVPAIRNIIPILEEFKTAGIPAYLEPTPQEKRNEDNRDYIHIYFKRDDLDKFLDIYSKISNNNVGIATLKCGDDDYSLGRKIKEETTWPDTNRFKRHLSR